MEHHSKPQLCCWVLLKFTDIKMSQQLATLLVPLQFDLNLGDHQSVVTADVSSMMDLNVLQTWFPPDGPYCQMISLGGAPVIIKYPCDFMDILKLEER